MHFRSLGSLVGLSIILGLGHAAGAAAPTQIAFSEKLGAEVFANPDNAGEWCRETVSLSLLLKDGSPLLQSGLSDFVARVGATMAAKCAEARRARVAVYRDSDRKLIAGPYTISQSDNWVAPKTMGDAEPPPASADRVAPATRVEAPPALTQDGPPKPQEAPAAQTAYEPPELAPFDAMLVAKAAGTPALVNDESVLRYWAQTRFPRDYQPVQNQEFKVRPVLDKARADLQDHVARAMAGRITLLVNAQIGAYDFQRSAFPITGLGDTLNYGRNSWLLVDALGNGVQFGLPQLPAIDTLPMDAKEAEAYLAHHTQWGAVDRQVVLALSVSYAPGSETLDSGLTKVHGRIDAAWMLDHGKPLYFYGAVQLADLQRSLDAKQRAAKLAILTQQREQSIASLSRLPAEARLANFISAAPNVEPHARLDNLAFARGEALTSRRPVTVRMLVQAGADGTDHVDTRWPGHLRLTMPPGGPVLERGSWYLVDGALSLEGPSEELKPAELAAKAIFACKQDLCADAEDPGAIVDHKLAVAGGL